MKEPVGVSGKKDSMMFGGIERMLLELMKVDLGGTLNRMAPWSHEVVFDNI